MSSFKNTTVILTLKYAVSMSDYDADAIALHIDDTCCGCCEVIAADVVDKPVSEVSKSLRLQANKSGW